MKKCLYKFLYPFAKIYWSIFQPVTFGVRLMLINDNKILLVRHTYIPGNWWMLPGGGIGRGESYESAVIRELKEELNIELKKVSLLGVYCSRTEGKRDNVILFASLDQIDRQNIKIDPAEILEYKFFDLNKIPTNIAPGHRRRIKDFKNNNFPGFGKW